MQPRLTDTLCGQCGLCCDGSLFADVELSSNDEASGLEIMGLEIEEDGDGEAELLVQPCRALQGKRCGIYPYRPKCCRTFECLLLQRVKRGDLDLNQAKEKIADALQQIARVNDLIFQLWPGMTRLPFQESCVEALAFSEPLESDPEVKRKRDELESAMTLTEIFLQRTFLAP